MSSYMRKWNRMMDRVLTTMDMEQGRLVLYGEGQLPPPDDVLEIAMHKARIERPNVAARLRLESVEWLRARGYARHGGLPLPPPGELPS